jgi:hypothetical protein
VVVAVTWTPAAGRSHALSQSSLLHASGCSRAMATAGEERRLTAMRQRQERRSSEAECQDG